MARIDCIASFALAISVSISAQTPFFSHPDSAPNFTVPVTIKDSDYTLSFEFRADAQLAGKPPVLSMYGISAQKSSYSVWHWLSFKESEMIFEEGTTPEILTNKVSMPAPEGLNEWKHFIIHRPNDNLLKIYVGGVLWKSATIPDLDMYPSKFDFGKWRHQDGTTAWNSEGVMFRKMQVYLGALDSVQLEALAQTSVSISASSRRVLRIFGRTREFDVLGRRPLTFRRPDSRLLIHVP